jgi:hypothetical protein
MFVSLGDDEAHFSHQRHLAYLPDINEESNSEVVKV